MNIPQDPDGIPPYVQNVEFLRINWSNPILFGRALTCFSKLKSLEMVDTTLPEPEELDSSVPFGDFGRHVTRLTSLRLYARPPQ